MNKQQYLEEAISELFSEHGISATMEQQSAVARDMECVWDGWGQCSYQPENPMIRENDDLRKKLLNEQSKRGCSSCAGSGRLRYNCGPWGVDTQCDKCHGEGKVPA